MLSFLDLCIHNKIHQLSFSCIKQLLLNDVLIKSINFDDFKNVLGRTKPTMTVEEMKKYEKFEEEFGQEE